MTDDAPKSPASRRTSALRQIGVLLAADLPRLGREPRTLWLGLVQFVPLLAAILLIQWLALDGMHVYTAILEQGIFPILIPLIALFYGGPVLVDEIDQKTLTFLTTRPVSKSALYLGKWLSGAIFAVGLVVVPILILFGVSTALGGADASFEALGRTSLAALLGTLGYAAAFTAIGVLVARGMLGAILYFLLFDLIMGQIPVVKLATVRFHIYNLGNFEQTSGVKVLTSLLSSGGFAVPWWGSALAAAVWTVVMLGVGAFAFSTRQYAM